MPPQLTVRLLTKNEWPVITRLFGARGACGGCWCMWWHVPRGGKYWKEVKGDKNRRSFMGMVKAGKIHGVLAFSGDEPVGWCQFGPRDSFERMPAAFAWTGVPALYRKAGFKKLRRAEGQPAIYIRKSGA
jgi:hypothetical protein